MYKKGRTKFLDNINEIEGFLNLLIVNNIEIAMCDLKEYETRKMLLNNMLERIKKKIIKRRV